MALSLRLLSMLTLGTNIVAGGCAEGTKIDTALGGSGVGNSSLGGKTTSGSTTITKGGATGSGGKVSFLTTGGALSHDIPGLLGGASSNLAGSVSSIGSGGMPSNGGAVSASGGAIVSTVPGPTDGLGIKMKEKQFVDGNSVKSYLLLVNQSTVAIDLRSIKLRYYFTMDTWETPVLETYYIGPDVAKENMKSEFFVVALPGADRYVETSFVATTAIASPTLSPGGQLDIQTGLHDQSWKTPDTSNDYSFVGLLVGFTDRITVYVGGSLVWGVEPGFISSSGGGGGGAGGGGGMTHAFGGAAAGSDPDYGGSSGRMTTSANAGVSGAIGSAGSAGYAGVASAGRAGAP